MKKKLTALTIAVIMLLCAALPISAATTITESSSDKSGSATIGFEVAASYTVTIPETLTLADADNDGIYKNEFTVTVTDIMLKYNQKVVVGLDSAASSQTLTTAEGASIGYTVKVNNSENVFTSSEFDKDSSTAITLDVTTSSAPLYAGTYTGTLVFNISTNPADTAPITPAPTV